MAEEQMVPLDEEVIEQKLKSIKKEESADKEQEPNYSPTEDPKPIVLVLQKENLDFSYLLSKIDYTDYIAKVCAIDYGQYFPTMIDNPLMPLPPLGLTTPMEHEQIEKAYREHRDSEKSKTIKSIEESEKGILNTVKRAFVKIGEVIDDVSDGLSDEANRSLNRVPYARFRELWLPQREKLIYDFYCSAVTGDSVATGYMFVTSNFLVFDGSKKDIPPPERGAGPGRRPEVIRITVPLARIVSFHRGVKKIAPNTKHPVFVCTGKGQEDESNSVLVYTDDGKLHVFYDFIHLMQSFYIDFLSVLDSAWRNLEKISKFEKEKEEKPMDLEKEPVEEETEKKLEEKDGSEFIIE